MNALSKESIPCDVPRLVGVVVMIHLTIALGHVHLVATRPGHGRWCRRLRILGTPVEWVLEVQHIARVLLGSFNLCKNARTKESNPGTDGNFKQKSRAA